MHVACNCLSMGQCSFLQYMQRVAARVAALQQEHRLPSRREREAAKPAMLPLSGWWAADLFLLSSCMWQAATVLARWLAPD